MKKKVLLVILGPTGVGKTDLSIEVAEHFNTSIVSCDSRQVYKEMSIGTAVPDKIQLERVPHYLIHTRSVTDYFNSWQFEQEALEWIGRLHQEKDVVVMTGGSMMYIDAVCKGIDDIPTIAPDVRANVLAQYEREGLEGIKVKLRELDPIFYDTVDLNNAKRVMHAVEVCIMAGKPYSVLRTNCKKERDFDIVKIGLNREKDELYSRIDSRVDEMLKNGLEEEARALYHLRELNALNTVGYKEFFDYFAGKTDYNEAIRLIKRNSRRYAKKQMTWFRKDEEIVWFHPEQKKEIFEFLDNQLVI